MIGATTSRSPSATVNNAIPALSTAPRRGFDAGPAPTANGSSGRISRSAARRWSVRGAPSIEAIAEDSVAAMTPMSISHGAGASERMMEVSSRNTSRGTAITKVTITSR